MRIDWNVPIAMDDGLVLRGRLPPAGRGYPVILACGPYAKGLAPPASLAAPRRCTCTTPTSSYG